jgi:peptide/nickel transport system permease protein
MKQSPAASASDMQLSSSCTPAPLAPSAADAAAPCWRAVGKASWAGALLEGRFGHSRLFAQPVAQVIWPALLSTLALVGAALLVAGVCGIGLGLMAAARPRAAPLVDAIAILGQSAPSFWLGILLIILFAVTLGWLPAGGAAEGGVLEAARHQVLPVATQAIANLAAYARHSTAAVGATLSEPWVTAARARGMAEVAAAGAVPVACATPEMLF